MAKCKVSCGVTINTGNFENVKLEYALERDCGDVDIEISEEFAVLKELVFSNLRDEVKRIKTNSTQGV